jgi:hypothetical protein
LNDKRTYVQDDDKIADTPDIWVLFSDGHDEVTFLASMLLKMAKTQSEKFKQAAHELKCDEKEGRWDTRRSKAAVCFARPT